MYSVSALLLSIRMWSEENGSYPIIRLKQSGLAAVLEPSGRNKLIVGAKESAYPTAIPSPSAWAVKTGAEEEGVEIDEGAAF